MSNFGKLVLLWFLISIPIFGLFVIAGFLVLKSGISELRIYPVKSQLSLVYLLLFSTFSASSLVFVMFYFLSDRLLLRWYRAKEIEDECIFGFVGELADKTGIPAPKVFVSKSKMPNAFALGRNPKKGKIVLTESMINLLDEDELKAVIAHEIVHIKNRDIFVACYVAALVGVLTSLSTLAFWASLLTGFGQEEDPAPNLIRLFVLSLVAPVAAFMVYLFVSPSREHIADQESVKLHKKPHKLISALEKLDKELKSNFYEEVNLGHTHLFTVNPLHRNAVNILDYSLPTYASLFNSNPSITKRIEGLRNNDTKEKRKMSSLVRPLFFSVMSNLLVLFAIIAADTFNRKDFDFGRATMISAVYLGALAIFFIFLLAVFLIRRRF